MNNILITGGAGMIGSNLVNRLVKESMYNVFVVDDLSRGSLNNIKSLHCDNIFILDLKLNSIDDILKSCNISIVVHLADIVAGIDYVFRNEYNIFQINNLINTNVISAVRRHSKTVKKFINIGTACSFPKDKQIAIDSKMIESDMYTGLPESGYGMSKLISCYETDLLSKEHEVSTCSLIFHNVYGYPCDLGERSQVIPSLIKKAINYKYPGDYVVWGSGKQGRAFLHVDDAVDSIILAIDKGCGHGIIQIGPDRCYTINEISDKIIEVSGKDIQVIHDITKPEGDFGRYADYTKATRVLGWYPKVRIDEGIKCLFDQINGYINTIANP
jgi:nucleoside-diphosphate-sugar epimerase